MMEDTQFDHDTGELFQESPVSQQAIAVAKSRMEAEEAAVLGTGKTRLLAALMAAVKGLPRWITTDKSGAHNIKYATLKQILETVCPILHEQGIRLRQGVDRSYPLDDGHGVKGRLVIIFTDLIHAESGEVERTIVEIPIVKMDPQSMGSAITYGRRYSLLAALGLATDEADDDGETAKLANLTDEEKDSALLVTLTAELKKIKDPSKLYEWGNSADSKKRFSQLDKGELVIMRQRYAEHGNDLLNDTPDDEKPAPKGKAK